MWTPAKGGLSARLSVKGSGEAGPYGPAAFPPPFTLVTLVALGGGKGGSD